MTTSAQWWDDSEPSEDWRQLLEVGLFSLGPDDHTASVYMQDLRYDDPLLEPLALNPGQARRLAAVLVELADLAEQP